MTEGKKEDNIEKIKLYDTSKTKVFDSTQKSRISDIAEALKELRKQDKRKFNQSVDLIINLREFDVKKQSINIFVNLPYKVKEVKVGAFLEKKNKLVNTITQQEFGKFKDKKEMKNLLKDYDVFIANAKLMPAVATSFGRILGPAGKMPSPQLGIISDESEANIKKTIEKFEKVIKIKTKEPSIKVAIGKESMKDEEIIENAKSVFKLVLNSLPKNRENLRNIMIKFSMTKPIKIDIK